MPVRKKILSLCFMLMSTSIVFSHPHLFIKPSIEIEHSQKSIKGIRIIWEWDKWWSEEVVSLCDTDQNGHLSQDEIQLVHDDFFIGIKHFNFFTEIFFNNEKITINSISHFHAVIGNGQLVTYAFTVPIDRELETTTKVKIRFNDETFYTAFAQDIKLIPGEELKLSQLKIDTFQFYGVEASFDLAQ